MKSSILFCSFLFSVIAFGQNYWFQTDSINGAPRSVASSFVVNGEAYAIGGLDENGFRRKMYSYSDFQDDWDDELSIGGINGDGLARGSACAFSIDNKGYICLGQGDSQAFKKDVWEFDPVTNVWTQKADFSGSARRQAVAFTISNIAYVGTGIDATGRKKDMYKYDPSINTWAQLNDFAGTARKEAVGFCIGLNGYISTGDDGVFKNDLWQYIVFSDTWVQKANLPATARKGATAWGQFPSGFICAGEDLNFNYSKELWEYNYFSDSWQQRTDYPGPGRSSPISFVLNDIAYVGSGYNGQFLDDMYAYVRILGEKELTQSTGFLAYPNPANQFVAVKTDSEDCNFELYNLEGKKVTNSIEINKTYEGYKLTRVNLISGHYILKVNFNNQKSFNTFDIVFK